MRQNFTFCSTSKYQEREKERQTGEESCLYLNLKSQKFRALVVLSGPATASNSSTCGHVCYWSTWQGSGQWDTWYLPTWPLCHRSPWNVRDPGPSVWGVQGGPGPPSQPGEAFIYTLSGQQIYKSSPLKILDFVNKTRLWWKLENGLNLNKMEKGSKIGKKLLNSIDLGKPGLEWGSRILWGSVNTPLPVLAAAVMSVLLGITGDTGCQYFITHYSSHLESHLYIFTLSIFAGIQWGAWLWPGAFTLSPSMSGD